MYCVKCGSLIQDGECFCKQCGQPVTGEGQMIQQSMGQEVKKKSSVGLIVLISVLGVIVIGGIVAIILTLVMYNTKTSSAKVEEVVESVELSTPKVEGAEQEEKAQEAAAPKKVMAQSEKEFKASCKYYTYEELARNPKDYVGLPVVLYGEVVQVMEEGDHVQLRVNITEGVYNWQNAVYVDYTRKVPNESRILEGDIITFWGISNDTISYETVMGNSVTVPYVEAAYMALGIDEQFWDTPSISAGDAYDDTAWYSDYIIPYSDVFYLSEEDLLYLTKDELRLARNEIYARHGRMFNSDDLQSYFNSKPWYMPSVAADEFNDTMLSEVEKYNASFIKEYEDQMN